MNPTITAAVIVKIFLTKLATPELVLLPVESPPLPSFFPVLREPVVAAVGDPVPGTVHVALFKD